MADSPRKPILGYADPLSVCAGDSVAFMVSCDDPQIASFRADLVRLRGTDPNPWGRGLLEEVVPSAVSGVHPARRQPTRPGSYVRIDGTGPLAPLTGFTLQAAIWPTLSGRRQCILAAGRTDRSCLALFLDEHGRLCLRLADAAGNAQEHVGSEPLALRHWWFAAGYLDPQRQELGTVLRALSPGRSLADQPPASPLRLRDLRIGLEPLLIGAWAEADPEGGWQAAAPFNGKIDAPSVARRRLEPHEGESLLVRAAPPLAAPDLVGAWDFSRDIGSERVADLGPNRLEGRTVNLPARGVTGWNWDGTVHDWKAAPSQYGAIHFHDDDIADAGWEADLLLRLPEDLPSGVYAARLEAGDGVDHAVFFVRPRRGRATSRIAFLAATATYLAYANYRLQDKYTGYELYLGSAWTFGPEDLYLSQHPEFGTSTYHRHADGSPVFYSSSRRPILNMRPGSVLWAFNGDMLVADWLDAAGFQFDVITDEDLHREGAALLRPYRAVLTGGHPEYASRPMLEALEGFTLAGGRLLYLGGNGFHKCVTFHPERRGVLERRWVDGGPGQPDPGEGHYSLSGELGGSWWWLGRPENGLTGLRYCASAFDIGSYYRRTPQSFAPEVAFVFEGVGADERIGDFGLAGGGAAGQELDWYEPDQWSPPGVVVLASSQDHNYVMQQGGSFADIQKRRRGDMVLFSRPGGGATFSVGSISWPTALAFNRYDNNVARITGNVLRRFLEDSPLALGG